MKIVCFGDSITASGGENNGWTLRLQAALAAKAPDAHRVVNRGFWGRTSAKGLDRLGELVLLHLPGIELLQWGINDCYVHVWQRIHRVSLGEFRRNLSEMVRILRERLSRPVLVIGHPILDYGMSKQGNGRPQAENFTPYREAIRALAAGLGSDSIDLPAQFQARSSEPAQLVAIDGVHLSAAGHRVYAEIVDAALQPPLAPV